MRFLKILFLLTVFTLLCSFTKPTPKFHLTLGLPPNCETSGVEIYVRQLTWSSPLTNWSSSVRKPVNSNGRINVSFVKLNQSLIDYMRKNMIPSHEVIFYKNGVKCHETFLFYNEFRGDRLGQIFFNTDCCL